jgi:hypothetical protein
MNDELEIEGEFLRRIAQTDLTADEAKEFGGAMDDSVNQAPEESATAGDPLAEENKELPNLDTDMDEMNAIKQLIPWDSFGIIFDPHYSKLLEETLGLPPAKAKAKSYYIYFSPENKRLEGVVNKRYIGGYGTKEDLGEDFAFIKTLSPEGFSPDWKEKLLTDIDELPAVENENVKEELRQKAEESDQGEDQRIEKEEVETETPADNTVQFPDKSKDVPAPQPVGKVNPDEMPLAARMRDITMRRMSRMKAFKSV